MFVLSYKTKFPRAPPVFKMQHVYKTGQAETKFNPPQGHGYQAKAGLQLC